MSQRFPEKNKSLLSWFRLVPLIFLVLVTLAACGGSSSASGSTVSAIDNVFSPKELHIKPRQTVTWVNNGQSPHTVTADDKSFDSGIVDAPSSNTTSPDMIMRPPTAPHAILRVPETYSTIQAAIDAAKPGDLVSIGPSANPDGTYHEAVMVKTPNISIRGRDRNSVILDGQYKLDDGFEVVANDVVIENITARHYIGNGFYWTGVNGYRGSYLTAYADGDYGIYAYSSINGQFDHDFAAGHPDSGFYIGACHPCNALITNVISEDNALGFSGTNAGGNLIIRNSIWRNNMSGIVPNTLDSEPNPPQNGDTIINNLVENNNNFAAPAKVLEYPSIGNGIVLAGGINNLVESNRISGHIYYGILVLPNIDKNFWEPGGNTVRNNVISNSGVADLALGALSAGNNCFSNNQVARTSPPFLQFTHACGSIFARAGGGDPSVAVVLIDHFMQANMGRFKARNWKTVAAPADALQPGMPDPNIDPQGIRTITEGTPINMTPDVSTISPNITLGGLGLATPFFEVILGFYLYYLPLALYAVWLSVATWDLVRRSNIKGGARIGWMAIVYLVPILGPLAYYLFGRSEIPRSARFALAIGAPLAYLAISVLLLLFVS
jgi:Right handed beta helix region/Phospholipase_D-nuclease N-terminal